MTEMYQFLDRNDRVIPNQGEPSGTVTKLTISGTASATTATTSNTDYLIVATAACNFKIGTTDAAATDSYLPANVFLNVRVRNGNKISVIGTSGNFYATEYYSG